jgi:hypothetical protein
MEKTDRLPTAVDQVDDKLWQCSTCLRIYPSKPDELCACRGHFRRVDRAAIKPTTNGLTDAQIIYRVYAHFGGSAGVFLNDEWVTFVKSLFAEKSNG